MSNQRSFCQCLASQGPQRSSYVPFGETFVSFGYAGASSWRGGGDRSERTAPPYSRLGHQVWDLTRTGNRSAIESKLHPDFNFIYYDLPRLDGSHVPANLADGEDETS